MTVIVGLGEEYGPYGFVLSAQKATVVLVAMPNTKINANTDFFILSPPPIVLIINRLKVFLICLHVQTHLHCRLFD